MKLLFVVNDLSREEPTYSTTLLSMKAARMGHEVWTTAVGDFVYDPTGEVCAHAHRSPCDGPEDTDRYLAELRNPRRRGRISVDDADVVMLRYDPADEASIRPWAQTAGVVFAQLASRSTIVLNDPKSLANALSKTYFQLLPEEVRPRTLISRDADEIKAFIRSEGGKAVLKPLQGSGGRSVFLVDEHERANINQMIDAIRRDGYVVAQEYLPAAADGDVRLLVMNGRPLQSEGRTAVVRRVNTSGDMRSNTRAGARVEPAELTDDMIRLVDTVRPQLVKDGMFLAGLDIVGDKLMEMNVFSTGGLYSTTTFHGVDFGAAVIEALEKKVWYRKHYRGAIENVEFATL
jgi:glutathione synthase